MNRYIYVFLILLCATAQIRGQEITFPLPDPILDNLPISLSIGETSQHYLQSYNGASTNLELNTVDLDVCEDAHVTISFSKRYESNQMAYLVIYSLNETLSFNVDLYPETPNVPSNVIFSENLKKGLYSIYLYSRSKGSSIPPSPETHPDYNYGFTFSAKQWIQPPVIVDEPILGPEGVIKLNEFFYDMPIPVLDKYSERENYVVTFSSTDGTVSSGQTQVQYYDGFGRAEESVSLHASPTGKDIVSAKSYWGAQDSCVWLPSVSSYDNGQFLNKKQVKSCAVSTHNDSKPYKINLYESSPLNRPIKSYGAGALWHNNDHANEIKYLTNVLSVDSLKCKLFTASCNLDEIKISTTGNYKDGTLQITHTTNEDGKRVLQFEDIQGKTVMSRQIVHTEESNVEFYDTYYVYDEIDQLLAILPPSISNRFQYGQWSSKTSDLLQQSAYLYSYAKGFQPIAKKAPGAEWSYYVYDLEGRTILSQSGEDRKQNKWEFQIPDEFNRTVLTGTCTNNIDVWDEPLANVQITTSDDLIRSAATTSSSAWGYSIIGISLNNPVFYTINYYDSYACLGYHGLPEYVNPDYTYDNLEGYGECETGNFTGLLTCSVSRVLSDDESENKYTHSVFYYDDKNRVIQSNSSTHLDSVIEKAYFKYNYSGSLLKERLVHQNESNTTTEDYDYTYDSQSRLLTCQHSIDGQAAVTIIDNEYDALGRVVSNKRNGHAALRDSINRNIRSWVTGISSAAFKQNIHYTDGYNNSQPLFSGNICAINWSNRELTNNECYTYEYDNLTRLVAASYYMGNRAKDYYNTHFTYDKMGNITSLQRNGNKGSNSFGLIDDLSYQYVGNQLVQTEDNSFSDKGYSEVAHEPIEYTYDSDGRMTKDLNNGVKSITYYDTDIPRKIVVEKQGVIGNVYFKYLPNGHKLQQKIILDEQTRPDDSHFVNGVKTKDYVGNQEFINGIIERIQFDGGYVEKDQAGLWNYYFYFNDYQGNVRCVSDASGKVIQRNDYYPYGLPYVSNTNSDTQPYKYGGKELIENLELNLYDFEARIMNSAIARFITMDPLSVERLYYSPYNYCSLNPISRVDPTGMLCDDYVLYEDGKIEFKKETDDNFDVLTTGDDINRGRPAESLRIYDKSILPTLAGDQNHFFDGKFVITRNIRKHPLKRILPANT